MEWVEKRVNRAMHRAMFSSVSGSRPERVSRSIFGLEGGGVPVQVLFWIAESMLEERSEGWPRASVLKLVEIRSLPG